ncbi:MAG: VOC family protein [Xenococcaceae cyanobacterium MO_188.B32]|nr:VOC family protein [Xenococcaceae cyanobacterium MO_188.B32]
MAITQCLHTAILVTDLAKAENFYSHILGLSPAKERSLKFPGSWYQVGEYQLHLIVNPDFTNQVFNRDKWGRNPHFALATDNLAEVIANLQSHGYPVQMSASGRSAFFTKDPDGNILEISQI